MDIALLGGTGDIGEGLALRWADDTGHTIVVGSRDADKAATKAEEYEAELDSRGREVAIEGLENADAAARADVVVTAVPAYHLTDTIEAVADQLGDAILVSPAVGMKHDEDGFHYNRPGVGSVTQLAAKAAPEETPVVGVMYAGSPRGSVETFSGLDALLFAGEPGSDAGVAVAETLVGEYNPSGKLAFTWPGNAGTPVGTTPVPLNRYSPTSTGATDNGPLYEFGHGLSYTSFEYGEVSLSRSSVVDPSETAELTLSVEVSNTGDRAGEHVVDVFNTGSYGSVLQPVRRLVGYERVRLAAGETTTVDVTLDLRALEVVPGDVLAVMPKVVESGEYELTVGLNGPATTLTVEDAGSVTDPNPVPGRYDIDNDDDATFADVAALFRAIRGDD